MDRELITSAVTKWILEEGDEFRKMAYIIANTYSEPDQLQKYLVGLLQGGGTPGTDKLLQRMPGSFMNDVRATDWRRGVAWDEVAEALCAKVALELKSGEHAKLRIKLEEGYAEGRL